MFTEVFGLREPGEQLLPYAGALLLAVLLPLGGHLLGRRVGSPMAGDSGVPALRGSSRSRRRRGLGPVTSQRVSPPRIQGY